MSDFERYWRAVADSAAVRRDLLSERESAERECAAAVAVAQHDAAQRTQTADAIRERAESALSQARTRLADVGLRDRLPEQVRGGSMRAEDPEVAVSALATKVAVVSRHVDELLRHQRNAKTRRLAESEQREREVLAERQRRQRELAVAQLEWDRRRRHAYLIASFVAAVFVLLGIVLAIFARDVNLLAVSLVGLALWLPVWRFAKPSTPRPEDSSRSRKAS